MRRVVDALRAASGRGGPPAPADDVRSLLDTLDAHAWSGIIVDGAYREDWRSSGLELLLGGPVPDDVPLDQAWLRAVHPDDRPLLRATIEGSHHGQVVEVEYRLVGVDGRTRWIRDRRRTVRCADGGLRLQGISVDVTARRREADERAEAQSTLHAVVQDVGAHPYAGSLEGAPYVEDWTGPGLEQLIGGAAPADVDPLDLWEHVVHPDDRARVFAAAAAAVPNGEVVELEYRLVGLDGQTRWVRDRLRTQRDAEGRLRRRSIVVDISAERRAAVHLARVDARIEGIAAASGDRFWELERGPDGIWRRTWASAGVDDMLVGPGGPTLADDVAMQRWAEAVLPEDAPRFAEFAAELERGRPGDLVMRVRGYGGAVRWLWARGWPLPSESGALRVAGISADVTERQRRVEDEAASQRWLSSILEGTGAHVFAGEIGVDGVYRDTFTGPGLAHFLGVDVPGDTGGLWQRCVLPADREAYGHLIARLARAEDAELEYRVVGLDGVLRVVWSRSFAVRLPDGCVRVDGILIDVTERRRVSAELASTREHLMAVLGSIDDVVWEAQVDVEHRQLHAIIVGPRVGRLGADLGDDPETMMDVFLERLLPEDRAIWDGAVEAMVRGEPFDVEYRLRASDGSVHWAWTRGRCRVDPDGGVVASGVTSDMTERHLAAEQLAAARDEADRRSRVDSLTGAYNRWHFEGVLRQSLEQGQQPGIVALDLDHFKRVNDAYGHRAGDDLLMAVAARIRRGLPDGAMLARWGGEEFVVLLPGPLGVERAFAAAEGVRVSIAADPYVVADGELRVTASAGVVVAGQEPWTAEGLIDAADMAMYAAKRRGRDRTLRYDGLDSSDLLDDEPEVVRLAEALARSAGSREQMPEVHAAGVAEVAAQVASALGLPLPIVRRCRLGGWLHDVGKVAVPDRILMKPGPLDDDEWAAMRTHAAIGAQIVSRIPGLSDAALAVRHHHERYDGGGYPDGLAGGTIPIEARVVAAVDAWSAMTSDRVYRTALDPAAAAQELRRVAGAHLDPAVVEALLGVLAAPGVAA